MIKSYALNRSYLARLIKNKGLTQKALAAMVPCSSVMINRWVNGKSQITSKKLVSLSRALEVNPCDLLKGTDKRTREYLEGLINKRIEQDEALESDVPLIDIPTFLQIAKNLGYTVSTSNLNQNLNADGFDRQETEAEKQMGDFLDG